MKKAMTVRLEEEILNKLSIIASERGVTRQDLVEKIVIEISDGLAEELNDKKVSYAPSHVLESIKTKSELLPVGAEVSLKQLVGDKQWAEFTDATRRVFGKQFRDMVINKEFPHLKIGRKKSNNEQQYRVQK